MTDVTPVPFDATLYVRDHCLCLHAQRAARVLARRFDEALRPHGLTSGQFSLLVTLNRPRPASIAYIASLLGADRTTLTAALKPLVRQGLVETTVDPADSRVRLISLTETGHARLAEALATWTATHAALEAETDGLQPARLRYDLDQIFAPRSGRAAPVFGGA
jgi:DNA-binding MarR family transcriptional regulator